MDIIHQLFKYKYLTIFAFFADMATNLKDFCYTLRDCAQKLEEELMININDCNNMVVSGLGSEIKIALDKAKDIHYKEILTFMREIIINIRKIIYHEEQIRSLSNKEKLSDEEIKKYSYVQRQVSRFDNKVVMRRERRRGVSNLSSSSLDAWEKYMEEHKNNTESLTLATSLPCLVDPIATLKRKGRSTGTDISETTINFCGGGEPNSSLDSINEEGVRTFDSSSDISHRLCEIVESDDENVVDTDILVSSNHKEECASSIEDGDAFRPDDRHAVGNDHELTTDTDQVDGIRSSFLDSDEDNIDIEEFIGRDQYPIYNLVKTLSEEHLLEAMDTKPRIVHVVVRSHSYCFYYYYNQSIKSLATANVF